MEKNLQLDLAFNFIQHTGTHIFLTGKAGTGKTTFLKQLKKQSPKRMIVVAPTGVAAINAGGVTIHSFFQLPFGPYIPGQSNLDNPQDKSFSHKFNREKVNIIRSMDLLVIDEISMVRSDVLDAVSDVLRRYRDHNKPFGGVQLLLIGDLQQLAPVIKEDEWSLLSPHYASAFFFDSKALSESRYFCIELTQVYRQNDMTFVQLLNNIREGRFDDATLNALNRRHIPNFQPDEKAGYITLTTHNYLADQINNRKLSQIPDWPYEFQAEITGDFPAYLYPNEPRLCLKKNAQVMFVKNDSSGEKKYYNGKIGKIISINTNKIIVSDEFGNEITVEKESWDHMKYTINPDTQEITEAIAGTFSQYPLKTAWAITIHKSQGLTFEHAVIDASAAFSHGQVYVALSRCKSLEGLVLSSPITHSGLIKDERIADYTSSVTQQQPNMDQLQEAQKQYFQEMVSELFDFNPLQQRLQYAAYTIYSELQRLYPELSALYATTRDNFRSDVTEVGERFHQQLLYLISTHADYQQNSLIQERICKGTVYFLNQIEKYCVPLLSASEVEIDNKEARKAVTNAIGNFTETLAIKQTTLETCRNGFDLLSYLSAKAKASMDTTSITKKKTLEKASFKQQKSQGTVYTSLLSDIKYPKLYEMLREWRDNHALKRGMPVYTILQQKAMIGISNLLPSSGKELLAIPGIGKKVLEMYGKEILEIVDQYRSLFQIKSQ